MKRLLILCSLVSALTVSAQTNLPPVPTSPGNFFDTVTTWATGFNTNNSWKDTKLTIAAGVDSLTGTGIGVNLANSFRVGYHVWKTISVEAMTRNTGISGTVLSQQGGLAYSADLYDLRITGFAHGGWYFPADIEKRLYAEVGVRAEKLMTRFTAIGIGFSNQFPESRQVYSAFASIRF